MTTRPQPQPGPAYPRLTPLPDPPKPPDAMKQRPHIARADQVLRSHFHPRPDVLVSGEGYLCRNPGEARRSPHPDCIVAIGVPISPQVIEDEGNGYTISEIGQPPDFVLEVASESTRERDNTVKREQYAALEVREYWRFDPSNGALAGDALVNGRYEPIPVDRESDGLMRGYSAVLELELRTENRLLQFWNPVTQEYLPDLIEALEALAVEQAARLEAEAQAAVAQAARHVAQVARQVAEERAAALAEELRRLRERLDPT